MKQTNKPIKIMVFMASWTKNNLSTKSNKTAISKHKTSYSLQSNKYPNTKNYSTKNHPSITKIYLNKPNQIIKNHFNQFNPSKKIKKNVSSKTQI